MHILINLNAEELFAEIDENIRAPSGAAVFHLFIGNKG
jgi:hypothetical protein